MKSLADRMKGRKVNPDQWAKMTKTKDHNVDVDTAAPFTTIDAVVVHYETTASWCVTFTAKAPHRIFIPKSAVDGDVTTSSTSITIATWLAKKEGLA